MTNGNGNRDNELELIRQLLIATAKRAESTDERLERLALLTDERINRLVESQEHTQQQLDQLSGSVGQLSGKVDQLTEDVDIAFQTISALSDNTDRTLASINASIQRQDRILDYLMRRERNGNGSEP